MRKKMSKVMVKKIAWNTTFGNIEVQERLFIRPGKQFRPFSSKAAVSNRGCSLPLQRVIVDFGADHAEADNVEDDKAPVRACHSSISNRTNQLDYKTAIAQELPIGSGEIESAHR
jgi:hypothetical protein